MRFLILIIAMILAVPAAAMANDDIRLYNESGALYRQGDFTGALERYRRIGVANPDVEYNMGITYYQTGDIGRATLHLQRAQRLDPGDRETAEALAFLREVKADREKPLRQNSLLTFFAALVNTPTLDMLAILFITLYLGITAIVARMIVCPEENRIARRALTVLLVAIFVCSGLSAIRIFQFERSDRAVAVAEEIDAWSAPTPESGASSKVFTFHAGTICNVTRIEGDFAKITLESGMTGWVKRTTIERI